MFRFEKLLVWKKAVAFADDVYKLTATFPNDERFGLTSQLRRASVSISANIAEGTGRSTDREQCRFVEIAYGSLMECISLMRVARHQDLISAEQEQFVYESAEEIAKMLSGLRSSLQSRS